MFKGVFGCLLCRFDVSQGRDVSPMKINLAPNPAPRSQHDVGGAAAEPAGGSKEMPHPASSPRGIEDKPAGERRQMDKPADAQETITGCVPFVSKLKPEVSPDQASEYSEEWNELLTICRQFETHCGIFRSSHKAISTSFRDIKLDENAIRKANDEKELKRSEDILRKEISKAHRIAVPRGEYSAMSQNQKAVAIVSMAYPIARVCLGVTMLDKKAPGFSALGIVAEGLFLLLLVASWKESRQEDLLCQFDRIERLENTDIKNEMLQSSDVSPKNSLLRRGIDLMSRIVQLLDSALVYECQGFPSDQIQSSSQPYQESRSNLDVAIHEYDQSIWDFITLRMDASKTVSAEHPSERDELMDWLSISDSYWLVEGQLAKSLEERAPGTSTWAHSAAQFKQWRTSEIGRKETVLWICADPGFGKSTLAATFIRNLKIRYPESSVAYFFCRRGTQHLYKARDVVRTLAYQCTVRGAEARSGLAKVKDRGNFNPEAEVLIKLLVEQLLRDPLKEVSRDIYIVLDGLDELGRGLEGPVDEARNDLIRLLGDLVYNRTADLKSGQTARVRLLLLSRADVPELIPGSIRWDLRPIDNADDIKLYVEQELEYTNETGSDFERMGRNPFDFFLEHAKGNFLWVTTFLKTLHNEKFVDSFIERLGQFSAFGDVEDLWVDVLKRIPPDDASTVAQILKWLAVAERELEVAELRKAVEYEMKGRRFRERQFSMLLTVQCASVLRHTSASGDLFSSEDNINLIHETLLSFLLESKKCPNPFPIDKQTAHCDVATICTKVLSSSTDSDELYEYASRYYDDHVAGSSVSEERSALLLANLHCMFSSDALVKWLQTELPFYAWRVNYDLKDVDDFEDVDNITIGKGILKRVTGWIRRSKEAETSETSETSTEPEGVTGLKDALEWRDAIVGSSDIQGLGEFYGKAAGKLWIMNDFEENYNASVGAFRISLKYYFKAPGRLTDETANETGVREKLKDLIATKFESLIIWATDEKIENPRPKSLGIAYATLRRWNEAKAYFDQVEECNSSWWEVVGNAQLEQGDQQGAVNAFENAYQKNASSELLVKLGRLYNSNGDYQKTVDAFEKIGMTKLASESWELLGYAFKMAGDLEHAEMAYEKVVEDNPTFKSWVALWELYESFKKKDKAENALERAIEFCEAHLGGWELLRPGESGIQVISHSFVYCDGCYTTIRGFRYKCSACDDFDFCQDCINKQKEGNTNGDIDEEVVEIRHDSQSTPHKFLRIPGKKWMAKFFNSEGSTPASPNVEPEKIGSASREGSRPTEDVT